MLWGKVEIFDSLKPVDVDVMIGDWRGEGFHTNHPMDGLIEVYHWYGKRFESPEDVYPLVFSALRGGSHTFDCDRTGLVYPCNPEAASWRVPMKRTRLEYPGAPALGIGMPTAPDVAQTL